MRKSRFMRQGVRQQLAGVVVNTRTNIRREDYDRLKAILTNCIRHGPASQNRDGHSDFQGHLAGRIAYVAMLNPERGRRLRGLFDRIAWDGDG
jgi:RNA-directed DNA polymerase